MKLILKTTFAFLFLVSAVIGSAQTVPYFTGQPYNQNIYEGQGAYFYVATDAVPDATYQWQRLPSGSATWADLSDTGTYSGTTTSQLNITTVTLAMGGDKVRCVATNTAGSAISSPATITVSPNATPVVANLTPGVTVDIGNDFYLYADVYGSWPMTFQWKKDGVAIAGATSIPYSVQSATAADSGQYTLTATNPSGTTTSAAVPVTVNPATLPLIYSQPAGITLDTGANLVISPGVAGTQPMTFQWKKDGVAIAGATSSSYSANNVTTADSGQYTLTATNQLGAVTSAAVPVTVNAPVAPVISGLNPGLNVDYGTSFSFNPVVGGTQPMTFQWEKDGVAIAGATSMYYYVGNATNGDSGSYTLTATNQVGSTTSPTIVLTVNPAVAPKIISNSQSTFTPNYGDSLSIYLPVTGTQPMTFQWNKDGVAIAGATSSSYYISSVTSADSGAYTLTATNLVGTVTCTPIPVAVNPPVLPTISGLPLTTTVAYGEELSLYPYVTGTGPIVFQWKKDGVAIAGATSVYYFRNGMTAADSGQYTLEATNQVGTVTRTVQVAVNDPVAPQISGLPSSVTLNYGDYLNFSPTVSGTSPVTCQWKKDGVAIAGASNTYYYLNGVVLADSGQYTLTATNQVGTVTSITVAVTVHPAVAPVIFNLPAGATLDSGGYLTISPSVTGTLPMTFQWKKDGVAIVGATSSYYSLGDVTTDDSGQYTLEVTNQGGTTTSSAIVVTVNPPIAPIIFGLPAAVTLNDGGSLTFSPTIVGTGPLTYQWKKDGTAISGAVNGYYSNYDATPADSGQYTLTVVNQVGTTTSAAIVVTVNPAIIPQLFNLSPSATLNYGDALNLSANVSGTMPMTFQWKKDGVDLAGQTTAFYFKGGVTPADAGQYTLTATNAAGTVTSSAITVAVDPAVAPAIVRQPAAITTYQGLTAIFTVSATGTGLLTYQWSFKGQPIPGATNAALPVINVQAADVGNYTVVVTNLAGSVTSNAAALSLSTLGVVFASAGPQHSLFIKSTGALWAMGNNDGGQLGDGTRTSRFNPVQVATGVVSAAAGGYHSLYIKSDKTLWGMGDNSSGQLGDGPTVYRFTPVQIATGVVWASAGQYHSLFIKEDGTLWGMGGNSDGQLGDGTTTTRTIPVQIASRVVWASAGQYHSLFIKDDGTLWGMGADFWGQLGDDATGYQSTPVHIADGVISASAGAGHSMYVKSDGTLWAMGENYYGELGDGMETWTQPVPEQIATGVISASAGAGHSLYIKSDGTLWAMGSNGAGQLGDGTMTSHSIPEQIATGVISASAAVDHSMYVKSDGTLWAMGENYNGQLGDGTSGLHPSPEQVAAGSVAAPAAPTAVTASDGTLADAVLVTWNPVTGATGYGIWRGTTSSSAAAAQIASNVPLALYCDNTAVAGTTYYYWVKARNGTGSSSFSGSNTGFSAGEPVEIPPASDFNGDGRRDILWHNGVTGDYSLWQMNGTAMSANLYVGTVPGWTANIGDFNGDGKADIFWSNATTGDRAVWLMDGSTVTSGSYMGNVPVAWVVSGTGDFDGDGKADILWTNTVTGERAIWLMNGGTLAGGASLGTVPAEWTASIGDFNGDGKADILWSNTITGDRAIWLMNGTSMSANLFVATVPGWTASVGDFNGDGKADIFWSNVTTGDRSVWLMNGNTVIGGSYIQTVPVAWVVSGTGDFDGDGKADILWTNTITGERSIWLMNGSTMAGGASLGTLPVQWSAGQ